MVDSRVDIPARWLVDCRSWLVAGGDEARPLGSCSPAHGPPPPHDTPRTLGGQGQGCGTPFFFNAASQHGRARPRAVGALATVTNISRIMRSGLQVCQLSTTTTTPRTTQGALTCGSRAEPECARMAHGPACVARAQQNFCARLIAQP
eukprot:scaffold2802_cov110-Isochrysis_galbana.AAC.6